MQPSCPQCFTKSGKFFRKSIFLFDFRQIIENNVSPEPPAENDTQETLSLPNAALLLVCSEKAIIGAIQKINTGIDKLRVEVTPSVEEACLRLQRPGIGLVLVHLSPTCDVPQVAQILRTISGKQQAVATLVLGDDTETSKGVELLRMGVADFLNWPNDLGRLGYLLEMLTVRVRCATPELTPVQAGQKGDFLPLGLEALLPQVKRAASQDVTVLLGGETGTGKSHLARLIHELSPRCSEPFFTVNCGCLSTTLIESELFGHIKGAFTGADRDRTGKFSEASGGTLFLDDIDGLPLALQPKLLRAVEERVFEPVGTNKPLPLQARLIAASNRPLEEEVAAGRFRSDLFFRLNVVAFFMPPLRERRSVVPALTRQFISQLGAGQGGPIPRITVDALDALTQHHWPGNIRELRNVLERAVTLCPGNEIQVEDLPPALQPPASTLPVPANGSSLAQAKGKAELSRILAALEHQNNNRARVAAELGVSRKTLYKKLHKYGLLAATSG
jgi:DNA-binding NtrC family response regulator